MGYSKTTRELPPSPRQLKVLKNLIETGDPFPEKAFIPRADWGPMNYCMRVIIRNKWVDDDNQITEKGRAVYEQYKHTGE